jgi:competence protein ComEA
MLRKLLLLFVFSGAVAAQALGAQDTPAGSTGPDARAVKPALVNLNTATAVELEVLPGVGPKVAARIVEYRKTKGPFKKIEELMNVQGIGEKAFLKIRAQITVAGKADPAGQQ